MAGEFASDNRQYLENRLGRPAQPVDLYLAHFLGAGGAARFLRAHDANPDAAAASIVPAAARANRWVFFNRDGSARSFSEVRQRFASKLDGGASPANPVRPDLPPVRTASLNVERVRPSPEYARIAYMMLAQLGE
jgi:hypothetical protein